MRAVVRIEQRHDIPRRLRPRARPWLGELRVRPSVARLADAGDGSLRRAYLPGREDYSRADALGQRGVYVYWFLPDGVYEIVRPVSWCDARRSFARVAGGALTEIDETEVARWL